MNTINANAVEITNAITADFVSGWGRSPADSWDEVAPEEREDAPTYPASCGDVSLRQEAVDWGSPEFEDVIVREFRLPSVFPKRRTFSRSGMEALVEDAMEEVENDYGLELPYNLAVHGPWVGERREGRYDHEDFEKGVAHLEIAARFAGWLRDVAANPLGRRFLAKTQSRKGMNSRRTECSLYEVAERYPSPEGFVNRLASVRWRANQILEPYGVKASWAALGGALQYASRSCGKAALAAAAGTLGGPCGSHREVREYMVAASYVGKVRDVRDGVVVFRSAAPVANMGHIKVFATVRQWRNRYGARSVARRDDSFLVVAGQRSWHGGCDSKDAIRRALAAWREQDRIAGQEADLVGFLKGDEGYTPFVFALDSEVAGNCCEGTKSWQRSHGFAGRDWIPGPALVPYLGDERVRRVAYVARERCKGM